ncbi:MAG: hypothetical protein Q9191_004491 [Dirinaria sp. TL-2023a]
MAPIDGLDDKIMITKEGQITLYINKGPHPKLQYGWLFLVANNGKPIALGVGAKRESVILQDIDGDGKADMLVVNPDGSVKAWINEGADAKAKPRGWVWTPVGPISPSRGPPAGVRFADLTGNGCADLIWLDEVSRMSIWRNDFQGDRKIWKWTALTEVPIDLDAGNPNDLRFADIDGDGKADVIWIHPQDGSAVVWLNKDPSTRVGWVRQVPYPRNIVPGNGVSAANTLFARVHIAHGRADIVEIDPEDGAITVWKNSCKHIVPAPPGTGAPLDNPNNPATLHPVSADCVTGGSAAPAGPGPGPDQGPGQVPVMTIAGSTYTANSASAFVISGQTLTPGGQLTIAGTTISLGPSASVVVVDGSTEAVGHATAAASPVITVAGSTYTANSASAFVIGGKTLTPGGHITVSGLPISLAPGASQVVVGSVTQAVKPTPAGAAPGYLTIGGSTYTPNSASAFVIGGQTLSPGGHIIVSGTPISLAPGASQVVVGSSTEALSLQQSKNPPHLPTTSSTFIPHLSKTSSSFIPHLPKTSSASSTTTGGPNVGLTISHFTTITGAAKPPASFPTAGSGAIDALKPLAFAALGSIQDAGDSATKLADNASPSSEDVSHIAGALADAFKDVGTLDTAAENIELQSFSGQDLQDVSQIKSKLGNTLNLLRDLAEGFGTWISRPAQGISQYRKLAAQLALLAVPAEVALITNWHSPKPSTATSSSSAASSSSTGDRETWILNTVRGTTVEAFDKFVNSLPDKGAGPRSVFPGIGDQVYYGKMTLAEAQEASKHPIVDQIVLNQVNIAQDFRARDGEIHNISDPTHHVLDRDHSQTPKDHRLDRRDDFNVLRNNPEQARLHQKALSLRRDRDYGDSQYLNSQPYMSEEKMGEGSYVYVLDSGLAIAHPEFSTRPFPSPIEGHIVKDPDHPNANNEGQWDDALDHGSQVASVVGGSVNGVAPKAGLVVVKFKSPDIPGASTGLILEAWRWAIQDIINKGRKGKAVINYSGGSDYPSQIDNNGHVNYARYNINPPSRSDFFLPILASAWDNDIVTVICAGNTRGALGALTPQRFGRPDNALITVGSFTTSGTYSSFQSLAGSAPDGRDPFLKGFIDISAIGENLYVPTSDPSIVNRYVFDGGTSLTAPQVAALAAYFSTSPAFAQSQPAPGNVAMGRKNQLNNLKRRDPGHDAFWGAYNGVREIRCNVPMAKAARHVRLNEEFGSSIDGKNETVLNGRPLLARQGETDKPLPKLRKRPLVPAPIPSALISRLTSSTTTSFVATPKPPKPNGSPAPTPSTTSSSSPPKTPTTSSAPPPSETSSQAPSIGPATYIIDNNPNDFSSCT